MSDIAWLLFFALLVVLFAGEPDLHDIIIAKLADGCPTIDTTNPGD